MDPVYFKTELSHEKQFDWLKTISLGNEWIIPKQKKKLLAETNS